MPLTASTAALGVLTASDTPGTGAAGLFDEAGSPVTDEGAGFILLENGT